MDKTKDFIGFLDKMQGLLDNAHQKGHIIVRIEDIENTFPELKRDKEREFNCVIVEEGFNEGDGFYKMSLAYLSTEQVEEIEGLVGSWNHNEKQCQVKESTEIQHDNKTCKENDDSLTSEDEKIGKDIVSFLRSKNGYMTPNEDWDFHNRWIPWFEKQGNKPQGKSALEAIHEQRTDNANKVERKFKVGDYIVNDYCKGKVIELTTDAYLLDTEQGIPFSCEHNAHLWSIQDAKDGDILVDVYGNIGIFQKNYDFDWMSYCSLGINGGFQNFEVEHENEKTYPATKEQRELLFSKMREAGYVFDFENKQLRKIEQKSDSFCKKNCRGFKETGKCYADGSCDAKIKAEQNLVWSKEDERNLQGIIDEIEANKNNAPDYDLATYDRFLSWLKSLKERATWKPSKEQIKALNEAVGIVGLFTPRGSYLKSLSEQLKRL